MAERNGIEAATFTAGFDFARRLRDPDFRALLRRLGWQSGQHVVMAADNEPVSDVMARVTFHETGGRAIIATPDPTQRHGFRLMAVEACHDDDCDERERVELGPEASVGMLYSALQPCGTYVPNEWMRALLFERVDAPA